MTDHPDHRPDPWHPARSTLDELRILQTHPSLAGLAGKGRKLDRLPLTGTAWAFAGATATSLLVFGFAGATFVAAGLGLAALVTASALHQHDLPVARGALRLTQAAFVAWMVLATLSAPNPS